MDRGGLKWVDPTIAMSILIWGRHIQPHGVYTYLSCFGMHLVRKSPKVHR